MLEGLFDFLGTSVTDLVGGGVLWLIELILTLLPMSPFLTVNLDGLPSQAIGWLNWFVDVGRMLDLMGLWVAAILIYMVLTGIVQALRNNEELRNVIGTFITKRFGG